MGYRIAELNLFTQESGWINIDYQLYYYGASSAYTMKGKEGYDALTMMEGDGVVTQHSMSDCFIDYLQSVRHIKIENN